MGSSAGGMSAPQSAAQIAQQQQLAAQQAAYYQQNPQAYQQDQFSNHGGGLMAGGTGQPLQYVPPSQNYTNMSNAAYANPNGDPASNLANQINPSMNPANNPAPAASWGGYDLQGQQPPPPPQGQQPPHDNGQGFMQGPQSSNGGSPFAGLSPEQTAMMAMKAGGQTQGGLTLGPNHQLVRVPMSQAVPQSNPMVMGSAPPQQPPQPVQAQVQGSDMG